MKYRIIGEDEEGTYYWNEYGKSWTTKETKYDMDIAEARSLQNLLTLRLTVKDKNARVYIEGKEDNKDWVFRSG